jgi:S-adenosylmethionine:tRNA ribosyltransferase-isomerase
MNAATWPREDPLGERLLVVDPRRGAYHDATVRDLPRLLRRGDLVVVNDAATLPASLMGRTAEGTPVEVRLAARHGDVWTCVLFGDGDWHTKTEQRAAPERLSPGDLILFDETFSGRVTAVHSSRLVDLVFLPEGASFLRALYRIGRPIQYAYVKRPLPLWAVQTSYASRPWAVEMPSAGRPLTWSLLSELGERGIDIARITHAAGLSSTGDRDLDAKLPLPERSDVPEPTVHAVLEARARGGRVIAVGTSVVRALEGRVALRGELTEGEGETDLLIGPGFRRRIVDGLFTGMHEPTASHYALLGAFAPASLLHAAYEHAARAGYLHHEFGDSNLILDGSLPPSS